MFMLDSRQVSRINPQTPKMYDIFENSISYCFFFWQIRKSNFHYLDIHICS